MKAARGLRPSLKISGHSQPVVETSIPTSRKCIESSEYHCSKVIFVNLYVWFVSDNPNMSDVN
ncbi:hypothetical protein phiOC_p299 [Ochrobactrum phage vB_OspM_OC]|nr:hypothetical protein phiOC_p299 [Ochrobactrum phage vB_OspM_OC]